VVGFVVCGVVCDVVNGCFDGYMCKSSVVVVYECAYD